MIKIQGNLININVHAPTAEYTEDIEIFYQFLNEIVAHCKSQEIAIVMGDFKC